ncbi:MAG: UrcA family protein [Pseudomonadota bacterium]
MRRSVIAVTTIALAAIAAPAQADPKQGYSDEVQISIHVTPADLESRDAVAHLYQRVNDAAASVCAEIMSSSVNGAPQRYSSRSSCQRTLVREALGDTPIAPLAQYYAEITGHARTTEVASR